LVETDTEVAIRNEEVNATRRGSTGQRVFSISSGMLNEETTETFLRVLILDGTPSLRPIYAEGWVTDEIVERGT